MSVKRAITGDIKNALNTLLSDLRKVKYGGDVDIHSAKQGFPEIFLPLIHFALLGYSRQIAQFISDKGHELYGKSDLKFMEGTYRVLRDEFNYTPTLTLVQFFSVGFAEQKMNLTGDIVTICLRKQKQLTKLSKSPTRRRAKGSPLKHNHQGQESNTSLVLGPSHAELGPRTDNPSARVLSQSIASGALESSIDKSVMSASRMHSNTIAGLDRAPIALERHNAQMNAAIRELGMAVEKEAMHQSPARDLEAHSAFLEKNDLTSNRDSTSEMKHSLTFDLGSQAHISHDHLASKNEIGAGGAANSQLPSVSMQNPYTTVPRHVVGSATDEDNLSIETYYAPNSETSEANGGKGDHHKISETPDWYTSELSQEPALQSRGAPSSILQNATEQIPNEIVQSVERLTNCVAALSERLSDMEAVTSTRTGTGAGFPQNRSDWERGTIYDMMARIEQRLNKIDNNVSQLPARLTLVEKKVQALDRHQQGILFGQKDSKVGAGQEIFVGPLHSLNQSISMLERTTGTTNNPTEYLSPDSPVRSERRFRPPSTSSPKHATRHRPGMQ